MDRYYMPVYKTEYGGVQMRSQLEAVWAAALDELGLEWRYEPRRIPLPSGNYLPDFLVRCRDGAFYMEVKGPDPTAHEAKLCEELSVDAGGLCILVHGHPVSPRIYTWMHGKYMEVQSLDAVVGMLEVELTAEELAFFERLRADCDRRDHEEWLAKHGGEG